MTITASIDWNFKEGQIKLSDPDTERYARWVFDHMTKANKKTLKNSLRVYFSNPEIKNKWLQPGIAMIIGIIVNDRKEALIKASANGDYGIKSIPGLNREDQRNIIGAAICELITSGELTPDFTPEPLSP